MASKGLTSEETLETMGPFCSVFLRRVGVGRREHTIGNITVITVITVIVDQTCLRGAIGRPRIGETGGWMHE